MVQPTTQHVSGWLAPLLCVVLVLVTVLLSEVNAATVSYKEIQVLTFRSGNVPTPRWGANIAVARNGKAAVVAAGKDDTVQFLIRAPYGWIEHGPRTKVAGAVTNQHGIQGFGSSVGMSGDGKTAIIGGSRDDGAQGAAWVFVLAPNRTWVLQASLELMSAGFVRAGSAVAISDDAKTVAVGSMTTNLAVVFVYHRAANSSWIQQPLVVGGTSGPYNSIQMQSLTLSANGNMLATGADDSNNRGAVFVFKRTANVWAPLGSKIIGSGAISGYFFGSALGFSGDGKTLVVGGWGALGPANQTNMGAVWVFTSNGMLPFTQQGNPLVPSDLLTTSNAKFGSSVTVSKDGKAFAVGAPNDDAFSGSFFLFQLPKKAKTWTRTKFAPSSVAGAFGASLAISGDAKVIVAGAPDDDNKNGTVWFFETKSLLPCPQSG